MNGQYIKAADLDRIINFAIPYLQTSGLVSETKSTMIG